MSGGSWDYVYRKIEGVAERMEAEARALGASPTDRLPERAAFAAHLRLVAEALHAIEWVDSYDWSPGAEVEPIRKCLAQGVR